MLIDCKMMLLGVRKDVEDVDNSWTTCNNLISTHVLIDIHECLAGKEKDRGCCFSSWQNTANIMIISRAPIVSGLSRRFFKQIRFQAFLDPMQSKSTHVYPWTPLTTLH